MKKRLFVTLKFKSLFSVCLVFSLFLSFAVYVSTLKKSDVAVNSQLKENTFSLIIVDPGHGGEDGGTASSTGTLEKNVNLEISLKLNSLLNALGYKTVMTRTEDKMTYVGEHDTQRSKKISDTKERLKITEDNPNGILLSIHQNYFTESKYTGAQVFYSPKNQNSKALAEKIQKSIKDEIQNNNERKIVKGTKDVYLLYNTEVPAVMVECGFMSNPGESLLLSDGEYQKKMAFAIAKGLNEYINSKE